jgi:hypothetical protein
MMAHANQPLLENQEGQLKSRFWLNYILCMTIKIRNAFLDLTGITDDKLVFYQHIHFVHVR